MSYNSVDMVMAAFTGISMYIGVEVIMELFLVFSRWSGLYFWSCALCAWGVILQPLYIVLADFNIWRNHTAAITFIYLTWVIMVVPQSWVLYSRLHLVVHNNSKLNTLMIVLCFTSVILTVPTVVMGILLQTSHPSLSRAYSIWSRLEMTLFFIQETSMNAAYMWQARKMLHSSSILTPPGAGKHNLVLYHLIFSNLLVILLDAALLGIQCASFFNLQGSFKPLVYGIKLKVEFAILNRLVQSVQRERKESGDGSGILLGPRRTARRLEWYQWKLGLGLDFGQTGAMIARIS
ncbi:hypothetical protein LA080_004852 [Diaporthe eres]|nr:hypothetical protein LA080_004852 [Diaporthe eres]